MPDAVQAAAAAAARRGERARALCRCRTAQQTKNFLAISAAPYAAMSVLGIDVGNATSVVALARRNGIDVVLNSESKRETPSMVNFAAKQVCGRKGRRNGGRFCGADARCRAVAARRWALSVPLPRVACRSASSASRRARKSAWSPRTPSGS
jgi:hypothetical protein